MSWATKYRSKKLSEMVGQEEQKKIILGAFKRKGNVNAQAWLITGPYGAGKTTSVRIIAKALTCTQPVNDEGCGECQNCKSIDTESSLNYLEVDAASFGSAEAIRELINEAKESPIGALHRVIAVDECHVLSKAAQTVLLKTLEDTPPHTHFILLTTDPQKLLPTISSRCLRLELKPVSTRDIVSVLERVCKSEGVEYEDDALRMIANIRAGHVRDALSNAETLSLAGSLTQERVRKFLSYDLDDLAVKILSFQDWSDLYSFVQSACNEHSPEDLWVSIKRVIIEAEIHRRVVSDPNNKNLSQLVELFENRLLPASEWCMKKGDFKVLSPEHLFLGISLVRDQLGTIKAVKSLNNYKPPKHRTMKAVSEVPVSPMHPDVFLESLSETLDIEKDL